MKKTFLVLGSLLGFLACEPAAQPIKPAIPSGSENPSGPETPGGPETPSGPETPGEPSGPTTYTFSASPETLSFPGEGGTRTFTLTTEAVWTVSTQEDWVELNHTAGQGDETISVTVPANPDYAYARRVTLLFEVDGEGEGSLEFEITQEKGTAPAINTKVYAADATNVTSTTASIRCNYTDAPSEGVYDRGVYYGTSASVLSQQAALNSSSATDAYFTVTLSSLEPGTTYYYKAFVTVWDDAAKKYVDVFSDVKSFTTQAGGASAGLQYLGGYEIPAVDLKDTDKCTNSGAETYGSTKWYQYDTGNSNQKIITHTYSYNGKQYRNWTALVDKTKQAPLWNAFVMQKDAYPDNGVGRTGSWHEDPGLPSSWQQCSSTSGFSRGHFVASNYRQATGDANKQTFYYTNQALQYQTSFNDGVWNSLELAVKSNAPSGRDTLYVVVGVLYESSKTLDGVPCPSHFYKCLMKCSFDSSGTMTAAKGCAYLFTNEAHSGNYSQGLTSIDAVEQRSGWDFFANVPKSLQDNAERSSASLW